jgi:cobalt/nickel transport system permease protein
LSGGHTHRLVTGDGPIHRAAPQAKLASLLLFVLIVVLTPREAMWAFGAYAAIVVILLAVARVPPGYVARRLVVEVPFLLFALFLPIVGRGPQVDVAGVSLSVEGLWAAWNILAKATLSVAATVVLIATTPIAGILQGLDRLGMPRVLTSIAGFMVRYLDVIADEVRRMRIAQISRGYSPRWIWQAKAIATTAGALFIRSYERGERVYLAMVSRGYAGTMPDVAREHHSVGWPGALAVPAAAAVVATIAWTVTR